MKSRIAGVITCVLVSACAEDRQVYAGTEFEVQSAAPSAASFEPDLIQIEAGQAVKVRAEPRSSGEIAYTELDLLSLRPQNVGALDVYSTEVDHEFVFVANEPGQTCVEVIINREREECIAVRVLPPLEE
jgi:hypothetical protein